MTFYIYNLTFVLVFLAVTLDATPHHNVFDLIFFSSTALQSGKNEVSNEVSNDVSNEVSNVSNEVSYEVEKRSVPRFKSTKQTTEVRNSINYVWIFSYQKSD